MRYCCTFFHKGYTFPVYLVPEPHPETRERACSTPFSLRAITGTNDFYRPFNINIPQYQEIFTWKEFKRILKDYYILNRENIKLVKQLIKEEKVEGTLTFSKKEVNFSSLMNYAQTTYQDTFKHYFSNLTQFQLAEITGTKKTYNKYRDEEKQRPVISEEEMKHQFEKYERENRNIWPLRDIDEYSMDTQDIQYKKKCDFRWRFEGSFIEYIIDYNLLNPNSYGAHKFDYFIRTLLKAIEKGYKGVKIDGHSPYPNYTSFQSWYYIKEDKEFVADPDLFYYSNWFAYHERKFNFLLHIGAPLNAIEGTFKTNITLPDKVINFTTEISLKDYGQSVIVRWNNSEETE